MTSAPRSFPNHRRAMLLWDLGLISVAEFNELMKETQR